LSNCCWLSNASIFYHKILRFNNSVKLIASTKTPEDLKTVQTIKSTLKIDGEAYGKGVGENDLLLMQKDKALFWLQMKQGRLILVKHNQEIIKFQPFVSWMV
jgi:hypothetical protein